jgi:hypothetical protein
MGAMLYKDKNKIIPMPKLYTMMVNNVCEDDAWPRCLVVFRGHLYAPDSLPLSKDSSLGIQYNSGHVPEWY